MTVLRRGVVAPDEVRAVQLRLVAHGLFVPVDGGFGDLTEQAVKSFQRSHGLLVDGEVGALTSAELDKPAKFAALSPDETMLVHGLEMPAIRCWPLRMLADGRRPIITSRHKIHEPTRPTHYGADLFYAYLPDDAPMKIGDGGRTSKYWIPPETWSVAPADGIVERCGPSPTGFYCWVRHAGGLATGGFHHDRLAVLPGQKVKMGDKLGRVNDNPKDNDPRHLHGELYQGGLVGVADHYPQGTLDPELWWLGAQVLPAL